MARVQATELGSIIITRLPPGKQIDPHSDAGSWAAEFYTTKLHWTVSGSALVRCADEAQMFETGTVFTFDNLRPHAIENHGESHRVCVIISLRCDT